MSVSKHLKQNKFSLTFILKIKNKTLKPFFLISCIKQLFDREGTVNSTNDIKIVGVAYM